MPFSVWNPHRKHLHVTDKLTVSLKINSSSCVTNGANEDAANATCENFCWRLILSLTLFLSFYLQMRVRRRKKKKKPKWGWWRTIKLVKNNLKWPFSRKKNFHFNDVSATIQSFTWKAHPSTVIICYYKCTKTTFSAPILKARKICSTRSTRDREKVILMQNSFERKKTDQFDQQIFPADLHK